MQKKRPPYKRNNDGKSSNRDGSRGNSRYRKDGDSRSYRSNSDRRDDSRGLPRSFENKGEFTKGPYKPRKKPSLFARIFKRRKVYPNFTKGSAVVASVFVMPGSSLENVMMSIQSVDVKDVVVSVMDSISDDVRSALKSIEGVKIQRLQGDDAVTCEYDAHRLVAQLHKDSKMALINTDCVLRPFALQKMLSVLSQRDVIASVPLSYNADLSLARMNKRFVSIRNLVCPARKTMTESGISSYYTPHRVDYSSISAVCVWAHALVNIKKHPIVASIEERDASIFKEFARFGKVVFTSFSRSITHKKQHKTSIFAKILFIARYGIKI